ncbi:MAG: hypothetical protein FWF97_04920 [Alphaproteobacteria bacterium]|nr:hypothetical protein [Alphaproteobacteria bacterium]
MSKILQIRRGSAAENNNFTGLAGELSFDSDAKTMRVHDGETLGGFALARADLSNVSGAVGSGGGGESFDIETVSSAFWIGLFAAHNLRPVRFLESNPSTVANVSYLEYIFDSVANGTDLSAATAECVLVCQTPEAGYAVGDVVHAFGVGTRANPRPNLLLDSNGLRVRFMVGGENLWVSNKNSGIPANITNANWKAKFKVWL